MKVSMQHHSLWTKVLISFSQNHVQTYQIQKNLLNLGEMVFIHCLGVRVWGMEKGILRNYRRKNGWEGNE